MRKKKILAGVLSAAMVVGSLALPENISISGFGFGALFTQAAEEIASGTCGENLTWVLDDTGVLTISGTGEMVDYDFSTIPWADSDVVSVIIEDGVTNVSDYAFCSCFTVESVEIPDSITSIGDYAFCNCYKIKNIEIPDGVTQIGDRAFQNCFGITSIELPDSVTSIGAYVFSGLYYLKSVNIPEGVTAINDYTFNGCSELTSIELPDTVTTIGDYAFCDCEGLTSIYIPSSVTTVGESAFSGCTSLSEVYYSGSELEWNEINIDDSNTELTDATLSCAIINGTCGDNLTWTLTEDGVLTISGTGEMYDYSSVYPNNAPWYSEGNTIVSVVIEEGVTTIGDNAFALGYDNLSSVDLPDSLTSIGDYAFYWCENLTDIDISDNITDIGDYAFYGCNGLADDNGFVIIRNELISYCGDDLEIEIPDSAVTIGTDSFINSDITAVVISEGVEEIGSSAFKYAADLNSVEISNTVTTIGALAFYECQSLTSVTIPSSVTSIGGNAFGYYLGENGYAQIDGFTIYGYKGTVAETYAEENQFTFIYLDDDASDDVDSDAADEDDTNEKATSGMCGDNLTWVLDDEGVLTISGSGDMYDYTGISSPWYDSVTDITTVVIENGATRIGDFAFGLCENLTSIEIPDSMTSIGGYAFAYTGITSMEIPGSVKTIDDLAFAYTGCLTNIELNEGLETIGYCAFSNCGITEITIPASVTSIGEYAFGYIREMDSMGENIQPWTMVTIYGFEGSAAETYVEEYGTYEYWDGTTEEVATFVSIGAIAVDDLGAIAVNDLGDINGDDTIDYLDAMTALRYDAELIELTDAQITAADVNGDGSVDSLDAILMLRYDAGLIEEF